MRPRSVIVFAITALLLAMPAAGGTSETAFTYQGRLRDGGVPANGAYNIDFRLWNAAGGGAQVGATVSLLGHPVAAGLITAPLDFGPTPFKGTPLWLEITIDGNTLSPRQALTGTPMSASTRGLIVDAQGRVGIGTSNPWTDLSINSGGLGVYDDTGAGVVFTTDRFEIHRGLNEDPAYGYDGSNDEHTFFTGGSATMKIDENGDVSLGPVPAPSTGKLNVHTSTNAYAIYGINTGLVGFGVYGQTTNSGSIAIQGVADGVNGTAIRGIATDDVAFPKAIVGISFSPTGYDFYASGAGMDYGSPSSIRWKRNIEPIHDPLAIVEQIRGVYFDWDEEHGGQHAIGFIGEEVGAVLPEVVAYEPDCAFVSGMDYSKLTPLLVEAVKALRAENREIREQNEALRERLERLEARVENP